MKKLYLSCGKDKHRKTFLFSDTQIVEPSFLEDINGMLGSGEVANLFASDEIAAIREDLRADAIAEKIHDTLENVYQYFIDRARERLHIVVCMSPVGSAFRVRLRMFPTLVNNTSIDWFTEWPQEALKEVCGPPPRDALRAQTSRPRPPPVGPSARIQIVSPLRGRDDGRRPVGGGGVNRRRLGGNRRRLGGNRRRLGGGVTDGGWGVTDGGWGGNRRRLGG